MEGGEWGSASLRGALCYLTAHSARLAALSWPEAEPLGAADGVEMRALL